MRREGSCGRARASVLGPLAPPLAFVVVLVILAGCLLPGTAFATSVEGEAGKASDRISEAEAIRIADRDSNAVKEREINGALGSSAEMVDGNWEVAYFTDGKEVALVLVDPESGAVKESWTGDQVAWKMARGYSGAFGHKLNAPYVFLPLCALFLLGLFDWRRRWRIANLDLVVLLGFGVSHFFFNRAEIGVSVPLQYPVLLYLLGRALWIGVPRPRRGAAAGLASCLAADRRPLPDRLPGRAQRRRLRARSTSATPASSAPIASPTANRSTTTSPMTSRRATPTARSTTTPTSPSSASGPGREAGTTCRPPTAPPSPSTSLAFGFLILLGLRIRPGPAGRRLAAILAFGWAAYPYTAYALESNSNDALVAALLVATLLLLARPMARGALSSLATFAKFAPALLVPMLLTYRPPSASTNPELEEGPSESGEGVRERTPRPQDPLTALRGPLLFASASPWSR